MRIADCARGEQPCFAGLGNVGPFRSQHDQCPRMIPVISLTWAF